MSHKMRIGILAAAVVVIFGIGLWTWYRPSAPDPVPVESLTIAAYAGGDGALVYIAEEQGYFAQNGLKTTIKHYEAGKLAADALLAGEADVSTSAGFVLVSQSFTHDDLRVLGTVAISDSNELVARKDHGIHLPSDLQGKTIGVTRKSAAEFYLGTFLTFHDLSIQDIHIVDLPPSALVEAIVQGDIDAALTWHPNVFRMKQRLGAQAISWPGQSGQDFYFVLLSTQEWINTHSQAAERLLRSLLQAEEFVKRHDEEARGFVARRFQYDPVYMDVIWPKLQFVVTLTQAMLVVFEDQARWRIENRLTEHPTAPNYFDFLYLKGLETVKAEAVTIIR